MAMTHNYRRGTPIGEVMAVLARREGASLSEVAAAWGRPDMPESHVITRILRQEVAVKQKVRLEVDLRERRVRSADFVRFEHRPDLADLVVQGLATETLFSRQADAFVAYELMPEEVQ